MCSLYIYIYINVFICVCIAKISLGNSHEKHHFVFFSAAGASSTLFAILARAFPARARQPSLVSAVRINVVAAHIVLPSRTPVYVHMYVRTHAADIFVFNLNFLCCLAFKLC